MVHRTSVFIMAFRFEDLRVWHIAVDLSNEIDLLVRKFPKIEVVACLFVADKRNYITNDEFKKFYSNYDALCKMITKLRASM
jgi:hypothetical protein